MTPYVCTWLHSCGIEYMAHQSLLFNTPLQLPEQRQNNAPKVNFALSPIPKCLKRG